jgi:quercetin dioxygenase-like cupin family protein
MRSRMTTNEAPDGENGAVRFGDLEFRTLVGGGDLGGQVSVFEVSLAAGCLAGPLHTHAHDDALSYVLEGVLAFQVDDQIIEAGPGTAVLQPRGIRHTFWNPGPTAARALDITLPAGLAEYYQELNDALDGSEADFDRANSIGERYGLRMDWDSLTTLLTDHGLRLAATP